MNWLFLLLIAVIMMTHREQTKPAGKIQYKSINNICPGNVVSRDCESRPLINVMTCHIEKSGSIVV